MVQYKQENLILNTIANKAINIYKKQNIVVNKNRKL